MAEEALDTLPEITRSTLLYPRSAGLRRRITNESTSASVIRVAGRMLGDCGNIFSGLDNTAFLDPANQDSRAISITFTRIFDRGLSTDALVTYCVSKALETPVTKTHLFSFGLGYCPVLSTGVHWTDDFVPKCFRLRIWKKVNNDASARNINVKNHIWKYKLIISKYIYIYRNLHCILNEVTE